MRSAAWIASIVALGLAACSSRPAGSPSAPQASLPPSPAAAARPLAIASFYPLYEFTARIAGDHAEVRNLVSAGAAPHDYEPTAQDLIALQSARLVVYNGAGFEPWLDRLLPTLPPSVKAVKATMVDAIAPTVPASILRTHPNATLYLDRDAAARLDPAVRGPIHEDAGQ